jgi:heme-binding protein
MEIPEDVKNILKNSCADCHSNYTKYPWDSGIAPVSWYLAQHVNMDKEHFNFSEWNVYNKNQKTHII